MENVATANLVDFLYPTVIMEDEYDISLQEDKYIERAYRVYREINNTNAILHVAEYDVDDSLVVPLPCNLYKIEAVTDDADFYGLMNNSYFISTYYTGNYHQSHPNYNNFALRAITAKTYNQREYSSNKYTPSNFIPYTILGCNEGLQFSKEQAGKRIKVMYWGLATDFEGHPLINLKEARAIAAKCALIEVHKRALKGDSISANMLAYLKPETSRLVLAASIPESLTQNDFDSILRAQTRHDRKVYWSNYKLIQ
jgi:hypothetical protein